MTKRSYSIIQLAFPAATSFNNAVLFHHRGPLIIYDGFWICFNQPLENCLNKTVCRPQRHLKGARIKPLNCGHAISQSRARPLELISACKIVLEICKLRSDCLPQLLAHHEALTLPAVRKQILCLFCWGSHSLKLHQLIYASISRVLGSLKCSFAKDIIWTLSSEIK